VDDDRPCVQGHDDKLEDSVPNIPILPAGRPTLAEDLSVLAWLQITRDQLSPVCISHLCGALLEWSMTGDGQLWPDPVEPAAGPDCDHLELLVQITQRLIRRITDAPTVHVRFELARVGRELSHAVAGQRDPQALAAAQGRELLQRMPRLARQFSVGQP